jgi:DNA polymerase III subunit delta'
MAAVTDVFADLVGQDEAVEVLRRAAESAARIVDGTATGSGAMTHAWIFTGPPGSGRSVAARAFAAALQCERGGVGCGECHGCHTVLGRTHADVRFVVPEGLSIGVGEMRALVLRASSAPSGGRWQAVVVEDADRLTEQAGNALLKAIEEPTARTVWMLCAPTVEDVLPTIRSRCRQLTLATPTAEEVAAFLVRRDGVDDALASYAARASQGHIGRARALARDEETRNRRREVVSIPARLTTLGACMNAAANLVDIAKDETEAITTATNTRELLELDATYGDDRKSRASRAYRAALRELEHSQKQRQKRREMDVIDRSLMDIMSVYRDAIAVQTGAPGALVNEEVRGEVDDLARRSTPEENLRRIDAIFAAREQMSEFNATPLLTLEAMMVTLRIT